MRALQVHGSFIGIACALAITACGDDGSGSAVVVESDESTGSACLEGTWDCALPDSSTAQMTISGNAISGSFTQSSVTLTVNATFTIDGDAFSVSDTGGGGACPPGQTGAYTYTCESGALSFTRVSDECAGRANFFRCAWTKR
jgi:hypothetical protein